MKKYNPYDQKSKKYNSYSYSFKKHVAEQVLSGYMSQRHASEKYFIARNTVASWCAKFGPDMKDKNITKDKEIKRLKDKIEDLELTRDIQLDILAQMQTIVGKSEMEKRLPKQLFEEVQRVVKKLK